jgi:hypothetical protein
MRREKRGAEITAPPNPVPSVLPLNPGIVIPKMRAKPLREENGSLPGMGDIAIHPTIKLPPVLRGSPTIVTPQANAHPLPTLIGVAVPPHHPDGAPPKHAKHAVLKSHGPVIPLIPAPIKEKQSGAFPPHLPMGAGDTAGHPVGGIRVGGNIVQPIARTRAMIIVETKYVRGENQVTPAQPTAKT